MNWPTIRQMREWAQLAPLRFQDPELRWLEGINEANVLYYRWLYRAAEFMQPAIALELGVCRAQASAHIAPGAGVMIGVDIQPWEPDFSRNVEAMKERGLDYRFIRGSSGEPETVRKVTEILQQGNWLIGLLFIDTIHTYNQAMGEFRCYRHLLAPGALVVMDDILDPPDEVYRAFQEIPGEHLEMNELHIAGRGSVGFGAVIYQAEVA